MSLSFTIVAAGYVKLEPECRSVEPTEMCTGTQFIHESILKGLG